eukprot:9158226-Lingulodinium_polyedra.AAC.1
MMHNNAFKSTVRRRNGSQIGRSRTSRAQQFLRGAWSARTRASRRTAAGNCLDAASGGACVLLANCLRAPWEL